MTDITSNPPSFRRRKGDSSAEYRIYFAIIFAAALPFSTLAWLRDLVTDIEHARRGPLARAGGEANRITPMIFSV